MIPRSLDKQKIAPVRYESDTLRQVAVEVQRPDSIHGIPGKARLPHKSQYVVPLPFVGFFGANVLMSPGQPTLDPLADNLNSALKHEISLNYPQTLNNKYTLKVKVDSSDFDIRYRKKGYLVVLFFVWFGSKKEYCTMDKLSLSASYELYDGDSLVKKGAVTKNNSSNEKILGS
ncbi:MAG TPA: hypothetical protein VFU15_03400, partial [Bacteroidia bacterium]|nr:hypothetical protein [Bacteroidia bacterium]